MNFENNNFDDFLEIYSELQPPEIPLSGEISKNQNNELDFLENLDQLNFYQSFSFEFPGLTSPSFSNNSFISKFNIEFKKDEEETKPKTQIQLKGPKEFERVLDRAAEINPEVNKYRDWLILTAKLESGFRSNPKNTVGAPYYGYFGMGVDPIKRTTGLTIEQFKNDPVQQVLGAVKLYKMNLKTVKTLGIYEKCKAKGYSDDAIFAGTWLGGPGGVNKFINGN